MINRIINCALIVLAVRVSVFAQIAIVDDQRREHEFQVGQSYAQEFNSLPNEGSQDWNDNQTVRGWYSNRSRLICPTEAHAFGELCSMGRSKSAFRAIGGTATEADPILLALRLSNRTKAVISGLRIAYEVKWWEAADASSQIKLRWRKATAGEATSGWKDATDWQTAQQASINHAKKIPDCWTAFFVRICELDIQPEEELWLSWKINSSAGEKPLCIDNVYVGDLAIGNPGIMVQPTALSVADLADRTATFRVIGSGVPAPTYQWLKDGVPIPGATEPAYSINQVAVHAGEYSVSVANSQGTASSHAAKLSVYSPRDVVVKKDIAYLPADRSDLADLYSPSPAPDQAMPAVIVIHGGGGNDGDKAKEREVAAAKDFAQRGYVAMSINYQRARKQSDGTWSAAWPHNIQDAKTAVRWLRKNAATYHIDSDRIGAIGFSWGGNMASMLANTRTEDGLEPVTYPEFSSAIACAANFYAANDIVNYHDMKQFGGATIDSDPKLYLRASPWTYSHAAAAPTLLSHGLQDTDVLATQSIKAYDQLRLAEGRVIMQILPLGNHSYRLKGKSAASRVDDLVDLRSEVFGFFDHYLFDMSSQ